MRTVYADLPDNLHSALAEVASERGMRIPALVVELIARGLEELNTDSYYWRLWRAARQSQRRLEEVAMLQQIAATLPYASAEEHEEFSRLCVEASATEEEIVQSVAGLDRRLLVADDGRRVLSAVNALREILLRHGREASATFAEQEMTLQGYSRGVIRVAKQALNVASVKVGRQWIWRLPDDTNAT